MKRFLLIAFLLVSARCFATYDPPLFGIGLPNQFTTNAAGAALPQAIVVSNNVTVDAAHQIIGPHAGSGAALTSLNYGPAGISTNIVPGSDNTNTVYITLSETNAANGIYVFKTAVSPATYTNANNTLVNHDDLANDGFNWVISNNVLGQVIAFDSIPNSAGGGAYTLPGGEDSLTISLFATNSLSYFSFSGFGASSNQDIYVDSHGSDYLALRGHPELPFRTLVEAALVWRTNDTVHVASGTYGTVQPLAGQTFVGNGKFSTTLGQVTIAASGVSLQNLSCGIILISGSNQSLTISGVHCQGGADALFLQAKYRNLIGVDSEFVSPWDTWADYQPAYLLDNTNNFAEFTRCAFINDSVYPGTPGKEGLIVGQGKVRFNNCYFRARQGLSPPVAVAWTDPTAKGTNGYMEFWNCAFDYANTNGAALAISNSIGAFFSLHGCSGVDNIYDPSNGVSIVNGLSKTIFTNWISGALYTNTSSSDWFVRTAAKLVTAAISGDAGLELQTSAQGGTLAAISAAEIQTTALSIAMSYTNELGGFIPAGNVFAFTNMSTSAGSVNSAAPIAGMGQKKQF